MRQQASWAILALLSVLLLGCGAAGDDPATNATATPVETQDSEPPSPSAEVEPTGTVKVAPPTTAAETPTEAATATTPPPTESPLPEPTAVPPFDPSAVTLRLDPVADGLSLPVDVVSPYDGSGRLFVVEKGGRILILEEGAVLDSPFLDLSGAVSGGNEQGLLGMAFEPERPERFYVNYTDVSGNTVVSRFRVSDDPNVADRESEEVLLTITQPASNHNGGDLEFGPDGYLWIGTGDGGAAGDRYQNGQNQQTLLGAMLRLDVSGESGYSIPPDNPYVDGEAGASEIWAIGLRNPWRYTFDRATGELWVADVGQNAWEEINRVASAAPLLNYGWPIMEADRCYGGDSCDSEGLVMPVTQYGHDAGCSVTGGYVYRGAAHPSLLGGYLFSDYCSGTIWGISADAEEGTAPRVLLESGMQISSFGEDESGELYLTDIADGTLFQISTASP